MRKPAQQRFQEWMESPEGKRELPDIDGYEPRRDWKSTALEVVGMVLAGLAAALLAACLMAW